MKISCAHFSMCVFLYPLKLAFSLPSFIRRKKKSCSLCLWRLVIHYACISSRVAYRVRDDQGKQRLRTHCVQSETLRSSSIDEIRIWLEVCACIVALNQQFGEQENRSAPNSTAHHNNAVAWFVLNCLVFRSFFVLVVNSDWCLDCWRVAFQRATSSPFESHYEVVKQPTTDFDYCRLPFDILSSKILLLFGFIFACSQKEINWQRLLSLLSSSLAAPWQ